MEAAVVGVLTSLTVGTGLILWYLMVHPELLLSVFDDRAAATSESFFEGHPAAVSMLQWALGGALLLLSFLTGAATAFLSSTTYY